MKTEEEIREVKEGFETSRSNTACQNWKDYLSSAIEAFEWVLGD